MSFWNTVGKIAGAAMNEVKEAGERSKAYKAEMLNKSVDELAYIIKNERNSSPLKASAAMQELKNRGYDQEEIKILVKEA